MAAVAVMMLASCSNEEPNGPTKGEVNRVTMSVSVADKFATRSTANEVNLGNSLAQIKNIVVVPMIGESYQNPVLMEDLTPTDATDATKYKKTVVAPLNSNVNRFKVYGNVEEQSPDKIFDENKVFAGFNVSAEKIATQIDNKDVYNPHGLYYYGYAKAGDDNIKVGNSESPTTSLGAGETIGTNKYVLVKGVNYAVGVLAAAVLNGDTKTNYVSDAGETGFNATAPISNENVDITGIIIDGQYKTLDEDFEKVGDDIVSVYEEAAKADFVTDKNKLKFEDAKNTDDGNFYVVVTETGTKTATGGNVTGNIEFALAAGKYVKIGGKVIGSAEGGSKFYLPFVLKPNDNPEDKKAVFMKDYSTLLNATVKDWGLISEKPVEITDVNLAVEIDVEWQQGIVYDIEI